ncbi:putative protein phosphatase 2C [Trypanosoma vivax]|uniref:PPM-type phosphatase domain-containing protein n=1 Tax=Trypanosoma vivax (strain Y486) TaxID=1055687 RepID=G0U6L0_TRYVY|nr:putative protein phosphatase 2C [Trypanosoma vivax]CCC51514.1 putative protein phosphatase 2C, fragment [Trypanosoma vivax Y486]
MCSTMMPRKTALQTFPLQHKKMTRLVSPFMIVGTCEVMNCADREYTAAFTLHNARNRRFYIDASQEKSSVPSFIGEVIAGGLCSSYTGHRCSHHVANTLENTLRMHAVLPESIAELRRERGDDPLVQMMMSAVCRERHLRTIRQDDSVGMRQGVARPMFSEWDMHQYAVHADSTFLDACQLRESTVTSSGCESAMEGCRAVWFTATVAPSSLRQGQQKAGTAVGISSRNVPPPPRYLHGNQPRGSQTNQECMTPPVPSHHPFFLDVLLSNVGDSRAFGIARNRSTWGLASFLDNSRERVVPLSSDHNPLHAPELHRIIRAGGVVRSDIGNIIDGNPFYNVSRSFGHWSMKNNQQRALSEQKIISLPTCNSWEMLPGDVLVLCNHAVFETRSNEDTSVDDLAKVVSRELALGSPAEVAAGVLCDYAIRFGAGHSLQVLVAVAIEGSDGVEKDGSVSELEGGKVASKVWIEPGTVYAEPCRHLPDYRSALLADCSRCGVTLSQLLELRWRRVRHLLSGRNDLPLRMFYGKECSALQQVMDEEALLFGDPSLPPPEKNLESLSNEDQFYIRRAFEKVADSLTKPQT